MNVGIAVVGRGDDDASALALDDELAIETVVDVGLLLVVAELAVEAVEGDVLDASFIVAFDAAGCLGEVRTERHASRGIGGDVVAAAIVVEHVGTCCHLLRQVVGCEGEVRTRGCDSCCYHLVVADGDADGIRIRGHVRGKGDCLLPQLANLIIRYVGHEVTAEVELVVRSAGEADDVGLGSGRVGVCRVGVRRTVVVLLVDVGVLVLARRAGFLVVVVPEIGVGVVLVFVRRSGKYRRLRAGIFEVTLEYLRVGICGHLDLAGELAQPVLMTPLGVGVVVAVLATAVEVRDFTLGVCGDDFCGEWNADAFPSLDPVDIGVGLALVPHTLSFSEGVGERSVEVLEVDEEMVAGSGVGVGAHLHHGMSVDVLNILRRHVAVGGVGLGVDGIHEVVDYHVVGLAVGRGGIVIDGFGRIDEPVLGESEVAQGFQSVVVEQRREEVSATTLQSLLVV